MRLVQSMIAFTGIALISTVVWAQPRPIYRNPPPQPPMSKGRPVDPRVNPDQERLCANRRAILAQEQQQGDSYRADMAGVDSEIAQLQRRLGDLQQRKIELQNLVTSYDQRHKDANDIFNRDCGGAQYESCANYDRMVDQLERDRAPVEGEITHVRTDIDATRTDVDRLSRQIQPLQNEYNTKQCSNLVPGATDQSTIDRCSAIFSDWNRLQMDLNQQNNRLSTLKSRYEQLLAGLHGLEQRASGYDAYMSRNCTSSPKTARVRNYGDTRRRAESMGRDLDQLIDTVARLKGARITVGVQ